MSKADFYLTLLKRSHLVSQFGVGSLVRTKQGSTALVAGLPEWNETLRRFLNDPNDSQRYLSTHSFREPELAGATGISRFVHPPAKEEDKRTWQIPLIRFPLSGVCSSFRCNQLHYADAGTKVGRGWRCPTCSTKPKYPVTQMSIFYACPSGHIDEIRWEELIDHQVGCPANDIAVTLSRPLQLSTARCKSCGRTARATEQPCTGARPWLPTAAAESCSEQMFVVSRSSVKTYYPSTWSAIHIPVDGDFNEDLLDYLERTGVWRAVDANQPERVAAYLRDLGFKVSPEDAVAHIRFIQYRDKDGDEEWDLLEARVREFDVLSGRRQYEAIERSQLISLDHLPIGDFTGPLFAGGIITHVTAVRKLTESRVLNGFSRIVPRQLSPREGRLLMWGRDTGRDDWLPGYRSHGEGIFLVFNPSKLGNGGAEIDQSGRHLMALSEAGILIHTFAHLFIQQLAHAAGYSVPSIRDRIYDLPEGRLGILVYTAEGDSMGTLGGLVSHSEPDILSNLIEQVLGSGSWCPQDPVCIETDLDPARKISASCHQCVLLPETSCELFNSFLDRKLIIDRLVENR